MAHGGVQLWRNSQEATDTVPQHQPPVAIASRCLMIGPALPSTKVCNQVKGVSVELFICNDLCSRLLFIT